MRIIEIEKEINECIKNSLLKHKNKIDEYYKKIIPYQIKKNVRDDDMITYDISLEGFESENLRTHDVVKLLYIDVKKDIIKIVPKHLKEKYGIKLNVNCFIEENQTSFDTSYVKSRFNLSNSELDVIELLDKQVDVSLLLNNPNLIRTIGKLNSRLDIKYRGYITYFIEDGYLTIKFINKRNKYSLYVTINKK